MVLAYEACAGAGISPDNALWAEARLRALAFLGSEHMPELQLLRVEGYQPGGEEDAVFDKLYGEFGLTTTVPEQRPWEDLGPARIYWSDHESDSESTAAHGSLSIVVTPEINPTNPAIYLVDTIIMRPNGTMLRTLKADRAALSRNTADKKALAALALKRRCLVSPASNG
jgi:hypothetical protein